MAEAERILSQNEVDALLSAIDSGGQETPPEEAAVPWDFRQPAPLSRDAMRTLESLHEDLGRELQAVFTAHLRVPFAVQLARLEVTRVREALLAVPQTAAVALLAAGAEDRPGLIELGPALAAGVVERLLGAPKLAPPAESRSLTPLEWTVLRTLVERLADRLRAAWSALAPIEMAVRVAQTDPATLDWARPEGPALVAVYDVVAGELGGLLRLIFPTASLEAPLGAIRAASSPARPGAPGGAAERLGEAEVRVSAELPPSWTTLREVGRLKPGDVLATGHPAGGPVRLSVEGAPRFEGRLGAWRDRKAVKVEGPAPDAPGSGARAALRPSGAPEPERPAAAALLALPLAASVVVAEKEVRLAEAVGLRPGDVVEFGKPAEGALELRVGGRRVAWGTAVRVGLRLGMRVTGSPAPGERVRALGP